MTGASQATGLGSAEAPEPHSGLRPAGAIPRAAFTPGPWHADAVNSWNVWAEDCKVARTFNVGQAPQYREPTEDERIANARLIAAAPELYDAAFEALTLIHNSREVGKAPTNAEAMLTLAIRKARGEQP